MPFWSRGGSEDDKSQQSKDFTSDDVSGFTSSDNFASSSSLGGGDDPMMSQATGLGDMQQFTLALRQQMMVQTVINTLTDKAFEKCITGKPSDSLSGKEAACVQAVTLKWIDTSMFLSKRLEKKMAAGQNQASF